MVDGLLIDGSVGGITEIMKQNSGTPSGLGGQLITTPVMEGMTEVIRQNLPLEKTLPLVISDLPRNRAGRGWRKLLKRLEAGESLESVAAGSGGNSSFSTLLEGGIRSGRLVDVLQQSLADARTMRDLDRRFQGVMIYSLVITTLAIMAATQILSAYMPLYELILQDTEGLGPMGIGNWSRDVTVAEVLISIQYDIVRYRWWLALAPSGMVAFFWFLSVALPLGPLLRYVPCIGAAQYWREFSRCTRLLELYLRAGLTYPQALRFAGNGTRGYSARFACNGLAQRIDEGVPLSEAVLNSGAMPESLTDSLVRVTDPDHLCRMLRSLGDLYEHRSREAMQWFLLIWEPLVLMLILGLIGLTISVPLPLIARTLGPLL